MGRASFSVYRDKGLCANNLPHIPHAEAQSALAKSLGVAHYAYVFDKRILYLTARYMGKLFTHRPLF